MFRNYIADEVHNQAQKDAMDCGICLQPECADCHLLCGSRIPKDCGCSMCQPCEDDCLEEGEWPSREDETSDIAFCNASAFCANLVRVHFSAETMQWSEAVCEDCKH